MVFVGIRLSALSCNEREKGKHTFSNQSLPFPPRFVSDFLHRREEILDHAPRAEMNLRVDLHAGDEAKNNKG